MSVAPQKRCPLNAHFSRGNRQKSAAARSGMLQCYHIVLLLRNLWQKQTGVLKHCHKRETICCFSIFWAFLSDRIPSRRRKKMFILLFIVFRDELKMNSTLADKTCCKVNSEFREIFKDTTRKIHKDT